MKRDLRRRPKDAFVIGTTKCSFLKLLAGLSLELVQLVRVRRACSSPDCSSNSQPMHTPGDGVSLIKATMKLFALSG